MGALKDYTGETPKNAFGAVKYTPKDLFEDKALVESIRIVLEEWLRFLEVEPKTASDLITYTLTSCKKSTKQSEDLDIELINRYSELRIIETMINKMSGRAELIFSYLKPHLPQLQNRENRVHCRTGHSKYCILDIGTGPGKIGKNLWEKGYGVRLQDVVLKKGDKRSDDVKKLESHQERPLLYDLHKDDEPLRYKDNSFDMTLLITVLHHCHDSMRVLNEAIRVTKPGGKIAILESVYDISRPELEDKVYNSNPSMYYAFFRLSKEQQKKYGTFLDWFLNKLSFKNDAEVPCNFNSPKGWEQIFKKAGLSVLEKKVVGIDQPVTPEFHVFYMLEKSNMRED